jgi:hypothetical protein
MPCGPVWFQVIWVYPDGHLALALSRMSSGATPMLVLVALAT